ncbi:MAG: molybdopterin-binding protein [Dehalococcoidia bacterium]|nr:molybdopterin-binding protein [Dehalococcoidia bacterium]
MKQISTQDAIGHVLCHDITRIARGVSKGTAFRKGHIVREEDIPALLALGKENLYVWEEQQAMLHENEAANILYTICAGNHMHPSEVKEGKIEVIADCDGLLLVDTEKLLAINSLGNMMIATRHSGFPVKKGDKLAGTRIIPLLIEKEKMQKARDIGGRQPLLALKSFIPKKCGIVTTGSEVFHGRIKDTFTPVIEAKLAEYGAKVCEKTVLSDDAKAITNALVSMIQNGAEMVICTGGMSVDPDDRTPQAIRNTGADIVTYGTPVLPGAMLMLAYYQSIIPVVGLPGCVMYAKRTVFDIVLPKLLTDVPITAEWVSALGHGGLCLDCDICTYPNCGFGKGA